MTAAEYAGAMDSETIEILRQAARGGVLVVLSGTEQGVLSGAAQRAAERVLMLTEGDHD